MDQQELETYEYQLSQIKLGLAKDPNNAEMQTLKAELEDLINLTKEYLSSQAPAATASTSTAGTSASSSSATASASSSKPAAAASTSRAKPAQAGPATAKQNYKAGDECSCRYSDGKWYPARITQISGSSDQPVYTVVFKGYDTPEVVTANDLRPSNKWDSATGGASGSGSGAGEKRKAAEPTKEDLEKERKKKKNEKKTETLKAKAEEQAAKQKGWQAFAKKGTKKGIHIPGVKGESIFRSPAEGNPNARVGVVGGGRGMTAIAQRKRQTFTEGGEELRTERETRARRDLSLLSMLHAADAVQEAIHQQERFPRRLHELAAGYSGTDQALLKLFTRVVAAASFRPHASLLTLYLRVGRRRNRRVSDKERKPERLRGSLMDAASSSSRPQEACPPMRT